MCSDHYMLSNISASKWPFKTGLAYVWKMQTYLFSLEVHGERYIGVVDSTLQVEHDEKFISLKWNFSRAQRHLVSISENL